MNQKNLNKNLILYLLKQIIIQMKIYIKRR